MMVESELQSAKPPLRQRYSCCAKPHCVGAMLQPVWISLLLLYVWLIILFLARLNVADVFTYDERWHVQSDMRKLVEGLVPTAVLGTQALNLGFAALYSTGTKRSPALAAALHCLLAALTFGLDGSERLFNPLRLDLSLYGLILGAGSMFYLALTTLVSMRHGEASAQAEQARKDWVVVAFCLCLVLWPVPHILLKLAPLYSMAHVVAAAVLDVLILAVYAILGMKTLARMRKWLDIHWIVQLIGSVNFLLWIAADLQLVFIAMGRPVPNHGALLAHVLVIVVMYLQLSLFVSHSITSFEEGSRFKAERDAMERELAARLLSERQLREAEGARQKFLRYVFHEIRVPFNSIDMGLTMLVEDVHAEDEVFRAHQHHGVLHAMSVAGRRRRPSQSNGKRQAVEGTSNFSSTDGSAQSYTSVNPSVCSAGSSPLPSSMGGSEASSSRPAGSHPHCPCTRAHLPEDALITLERIVKASESMKVIINDTLDWTKLQSGSFKISPGPADLLDVVRTSISGLTPMSQHGQFKVQLAEALDTHIPRCLLADKVRLQQVVSNFVSNAIKFSPSDGTGRVTVSAYLVDSRPKGASGAHEFDGTGIWWKEADTETAQTAAHVEAQLPSPPPPPAACVVVDVDNTSQRAMLPRLFCPSLGETGHQKVVEQGYALVLDPCTPQDRTSSDHSRSVLGGSWLAPSTGVGSDDNRREVPGSVRCCTVVISVKDNGGGFHPSESGLLFSAFRQLDAGMQFKGKGTGLGLAICHEIVSLHGGRVGVRSSGKAGEGAEFLLALRLPILCQQEEQRSVVDVLPDPASTASHHPPQHTSHATASSASIWTSPAVTLAADKEAPVPAVPTGPVRPPLAPSVNFLRAQALASHALACASSTEDTSNLHSTRNSRSGLGSTEARVGVHSHSSKASVDAVHAEVVEEQSFAAMAQSVSPGHHTQEQDQPPGSLSPWTMGTRVFSNASADSDNGLAVVAHASCDASPAALPAPAATRKLITLRMLIVDDVLDSRRLLGKALVRRLHTLAPALHVVVDEAEDGSIAVEMACQDGPHRYDVITMDAEMPIMSGFDATQALRKAGFQGFIYGCTGNALEEDQALFRSRGVDGEVFVKPLDISALAKRIVKDCGGGPRE